MGERGNIFLVDRKQWDKAASLGLGQGITYLILARGTGPDNAITSWLAKAVEKHTGIGRKRAAQYIDALKSKQLLRQSPNINGWPRLALSLTKEPEWIFMPNSIVDGVAGEVPPLERLRRNGSIEALRMFVEAYAMQDLANDDGLDWRYISKSYKRSAVTERGIWSIWGFDAEAATVTRDCPLVHQFENNKERFPKFWKAFGILRDSGLVECHPYLIEGMHDGAELIFPLDEKGTEIEQGLFLAAGRAAHSLLDDSSGFQHQLDDHEIVTPVSRDWPNAQVVGIYRLRYRPKTKATAFWYSKQAEWAKWADEFNAVANGQLRTAENCQSAPSRIVQGR